jgi:hypothetical protein
MRAIDERDCLDRAAALETRAALAHDANCSARNAHSTADEMEARA